MYKLLLFLFPFTSFSQEILSFEQAIQLALKNNYSILIAKDQTEISKENIQLGKAGFLPDINLVAGGNFNTSNTKLEFSSGTTTSRNGAISSGINSGVNLNWTIFDGFKMFATYDKYKAIDKQEQIKLKVEIENTIFNIAKAYYDIVKQQQLLKANNQLIAYIEERVTLADKKFEFGSASKTDLLQAKVDLNEQKALQLELEAGIYAAKINLNAILGQKLEQEFTLTDSIILQPLVSLDELKKASSEKNNQVLVAKENMNIANYQLQETKSLRLPQVSLNTSYLFSKNKNQVGVLLLNQNLGLNTGITASWNIFDGFTNKTQVKTSLIQLNQYDWLYKEIKQETESALFIAYKKYTQALKSLALEEENLLLVKENIAIALERFNIGTSNSLELMAAQNSYENAISRLVNARYRAKMAEIELQKLSGNLIANSN